MVPPLSIKRSPRPAGCPLVDVMIPISTRMVHSSPPLSGKFRAGRGFGTGDVTTQTTRPVLIGGLTDVSSFFIILLVVSDADRRNFASKKRFE